MSGKSYSIRGHSADEFGWLETTGPQPWNQHRYILMPPPELNAGVLDNFPSTSHLETLQAQKAEAHKRIVQLEANIRQLREIIFSLLTDTTPYDWNNDSINGSPSDN